MSKKKSRHSNHNNDANSRIRAAKKAGYTIMQKYTKLGSHKITTGYYAVKDDKAVTGILATIGDTLSKINY